MSRRTWWFVLFSVAGLSALAGVAYGVQPQAQGFKNIQVLQDMTPAQIQMQMAAWNVALGVTCFECHVQGDFADETRPLKAVARNMVRMENALNAGPYFSNSNRKADCYMCHQGTRKISTAP